MSSINVLTGIKATIKVREFSCWGQFLSLMFGQITHRESIRDIVVCLKAHQGKVYHLGIKQVVSHPPLGVVCDYVVNIIDKKVNLLSGHTAGVWCSVFPVHSGVVVTDQAERG